MLILQIVFWVCFSLLAWTYLAYPWCMVLLSRLLPKPWQRAEYPGSVSMIVAAHNEEEIIREKVENCLQLDFGPADAQIVIVSDGSTDRTDKILEEFSGVDSKLRTISYQPRAGKANALNVGVAQSRGDVLIFTDANVMVGQQSIRTLLEPFADPAVGAVCGRVLLHARGTQEVKVGDPHSVFIHPLADDVLDLELDGVTLFVHLDFFELHLALGKRLRLFLRFRLHDNAGFLRVDLVLAGNPAPPKGHSPAS